MSTIDIGIAKSAFPLAGVATSVASTRITTTNHPVPQPARDADVFYVGSVKIAGATERRQSTRSPSVA